MPSTLEVDTLKNSGGTKTLAEVSGGEWVFRAPYLETPRTFSSDLSIPSGTNALLVGPVTFSGDSELTVNGELTVV